MVMHTPQGGKEFSHSGILTFCCGACVWNSAEYERQHRAPGMIGFIVDYP